MIKDQKHKQLVLASWISISGNAFLAILKVIIGFVSGSFAVVGDGIDSIGDILASIITLLTAKIINRPPDAKYSYGYVKADAIASKLLAFIIFFAGAQLAISTITKFVNNDIGGIPSIYAVYVTIFSIIGKYILALTQFRIGRRVKSEMLIANGKNMQGDVFISISVLVGLIGTLYFKIPAIDLVFAFGVSIWIMKVGFSIFLETSKELMDGVKDPSLYKKIFDEIEKVEGAHNPHKVRMRKIGDLYSVVCDIEVEDNKTVRESHEIAQQVENKIKSALENVFDVVVHVEPIGNVEDEEFGLSKDKL